MTVPRVLPMDPSEMDPRNAQIARDYARQRGVSGLPNVFATLARHQDLFPAYMAFAEKLTPGGTLPMRDAELVILRIAVNTDCHYEWYHHSRIAVQAGITEEQVANVRDATNSVGWSPHQRALLRAADELHGHQRVGDETWSILRESYSDQQMIELCMLVGNYETLAMVLMSLRVQVE